MRPTVLLHWCSWTVISVLQSFWKKRGVHIPVRHCSNSAGIIRVPEANLNVVRAGITIYGIYPSEEVERDIVKLTPGNGAEKSCILCKNVERGTAVSYGGTFVQNALPEWQRSP